MSLHTASYFAGVGTVVATMAIGFGGGVMLTDAFVGKSEKTPTLIERRAAQPVEQPVPVVAAAPMAAPEQRTDAAAAPPVPPQSSQPQQAPAVQLATPPVAPAAAQQSQALTQATAAPLPALQPAARSMGRVQEIQPTEAELRKSAAAERRKQERRKWAERRRREIQQDEEQAAVAERVKEIEREREPVFRSFAAESPTVGRVPTISLFGDSDD